MKSKVTYLEASYTALSATGRPMTSREIAHFILVNEIASIRGSTPWKTINARISAEILENDQASRFIRVGPGLFALREWQQQTEYTAPRRIINPTKENIAVVPQDIFKPFLTSRADSLFYDIDYGKLLTASIGMQRLAAEETDDFVQIIPLFFVYDGASYLTYKRTKRLPEQRLHGTRSINFGGHLQVSDFPALFRSDQETVDGALQRELREELEFVPDAKQITFFGAIHDRSNFFGRQHIGLVFEVRVDASVTMSSNEPGFLTAIEKLTKDQILSAQDEFDDWTTLVLREHNG